MMKKILLFSALVVAFASCKEDEPKIVPSYPTDGLTLEQKSNALLLMGSSNQNPASAAFEAIRLMTDYDYKGRMNTLHMLTTQNGGLYPAYADSIMMNFQSPLPPYFVVGTQNIFPPTDLEGEIKRATREQPLLAVSHKVTQNDTSWVVDHKVQFFMDTIYDQIFIDTYMLAKLKAQVYNANTADEVDLRMAATPDLIKNPPLPLPNESQWDIDVRSTDSTKILAAKNTPFYYQNLFFDKYDSTSTWGPQLGSYWPFGGEFYNGDIIGTKDTPIRHYFMKPKPGEDMQLSGYEIKFMSIVWVRDPITGSMKHANSYISNSTFKIASAP